jgi:hypothetical protein
MGHENEKSTFYGGLASGMNAGMKQARRIGTEYAIPGNTLHPEDQDPNG